MGFCSRSQAARLIRQQHVSVNGRLACDPDSPVRIPQDQVEIDGVLLEKRSFIYLVMNKPRGVVTTASDEKGRATVYDLLDELRPEGTKQWVAPVGRLDKASEGLLLLTNDSEWAARITDPASHLDKIYHLQVDRVADDELLGKIERGDDSRPLRAKRARLLRSGAKNSWLEIVLDEGKNRQIRRLLAALNVGVLRLVRVAIGQLELGDLKKGSVRALTRNEKSLLDRALMHKAK